MGLMLYIPKPDIPTTLGWVHDATDWELSDDISFKTDNIVASSREDVNNKRSIFLDVELDTDKDYYARARVICNKGIFDWSHIDFIRIKDFVNISHSYNIPSVVMTPVLTVNFSQDSIPVNGFLVETSEISTTSNAVHKSTSYVIKSLNGDVKYVDIDNTTELTRKIFNNVRLEPNNSYILEVYHRSTSNDLSRPARLLLTVTEDKRFKYNGTTVNPDITDGLSVNVGSTVAINGINVVLYVNDNDINKQVFSESVASSSLVIPNTVLYTAKHKKYILGISITDENNTDSNFNYYYLTFK